MKHELRLVTLDSKFYVAIGIILILFISALIYPGVHAQTDTSFTPADQFPIPSVNGTLNFAVSGNYSEATLENDSWVFQNLSLNGSVKLDNFRVSTQNSNVTIFSYLLSITTIQSLRLRYLVEGHGKQVFNFGAQGGQWHGGGDWSVITSHNVYLSQGIDWTIFPNGTIVVPNSSTGNYSIVYYNFYGDNLLGLNLPFYEQHSVAIATSIVVAVVIALAVAITLTNRKYSIKKSW